MYVILTEKVLQHIFQVFFIFEFTGYKAVMTKRLSWNYS